MKKKLLAMLMAVAILVGVITAGSAIDTPVLSAYTGETFTDNLQTRQTVNFHTVRLPSDGRVSLNFTHGGVNESVELWQITMLTLDGTVLTDFTATGLSVEVGAYVGFLAMGTYRVRVQPHRTWRHSNATYTLTVNFVENTGGFEVEPNDTAETATKIALNTPIMGNLVTADDVDFFEVVLPSNGEVLLDFTHDGVNESRALWQITALALDGTIHSEFTSTGLSVEVSENVGRLLAGTYRIQVKPHRTWQHSNIDYTLTVNFDSEPAVETCDTCKNEVTACVCVTCADCSTVFVGNFCNNCGLHAPDVDSRPCDCPSLPTECTFDCTCDCPPLPTECTFDCPEPCERHHCDDDDCDECDRRHCDEGDCVPCLLLHCTDACGECDCLLKMLAQDGKPTVQCALQILRSLVGLPNVIDGTA
jgi:hypothetical protein